MNSWGGGNSWLRRPFRSDRKSRGSVVRRFQTKRPPASVRLSPDGNALTGVDLLAAARTRLRRVNTV